ncbi:MAG: FtsH protease activity modulator HflK [Pseudomonadota bacterium]|nr:FtsH protease activity modulator HflK [Pseudomonadota bacterium]
MTSNNGHDGGPWGRPPGDQQSDPWGRKPSGPPPTPPDIEAILKESRDKLKQWLPEGAGPKRVILLGLILLAALWLLTGIYIVQPNERGVELIFGRWDEQTTGPGIQYNWPAPIGQVITPGVTEIRRLTIGFSETGRSSSDVSDESLMLTGDENIIDIDFVVTWYIKHESAEGSSPSGMTPGNAGNYLFKIRDPEVIIKRAAESAMREVIGQTPIQEALTVNRAEIEDKTKKTLQRILDDYETGVAVQKVQLQKVDPPLEVIDAFNDVQRANADKVRLKNEADAYSNRILQEAEGDARRTIEQATAYKESAVSKATGDASRFLSVLEAYEESRDVTARRLYLETMEQVMSGARKVVIGNEAAGANGVLPYLPLDAITRTNKEGK